MPRANAPLTGVSAAIRSLDKIGVRGSQALLAREVGVTRAAVQQWTRAEIPILRLRRVAEITGLDFAILRPDYREAFRRELGVSADEFFKAAEPPPAKRRKNGH